MSVTITITGDADYVRDQLTRLLAAPAAPVQMALPLASLTPIANPGATTTFVGDTGNAPFVTNTPRAGESEDQTAARTRRGRPRKDAGSAEAPAASPEPDSSTAPPAEEPSSLVKAMTAAEAEASRNENAVEVTLDDVRDALRALAGAKGVEECSALLAKFGAGKSSELKPEDRAAFVAEAKARS